MSTTEHQEINQLDTITPEVVEAARQTLVVGAQ